MLIIVYVIFYEFLNKNKIYSYLIFLKYYLTLQDLIFNV